MGAMVTVVHNNEVVLLYAEESLLVQVAEWVRRHPPFSLRVVASRSDGGIDSALSDAVLAIIDTAEHPGRALDALRSVSARLGPQNVVVYTERTYDSLEIVVRVRGAKLLLGPMSPLEWEGFFEQLTRKRAAPAKAARGVRSAPDGSKG